MKHGLTIVKKGEKHQVLIIESLNDKSYEIFFRNDESYENILLDLHKKDFDNHRDIWWRLCKFVDHLSPMIIAFVSEDALVPKTSLLVSRSDEVITLNCLSIGGDGGVPHPPIRFGSIIVSAGKSHSRNLAALPGEVNPERFKLKLCSILGSIIISDAIIEITS